MYPTGITGVLREGNIMVDDIKNSVVNVAKNTWRNSMQYAHIFDYGKSIRTLENLFYFAQKIPYKMDEYHQYISPANATFFYYLERKQAQDCKNKSIFICSILKCLGFETGFVFCGFNGGQVQHVYSFVILNGKEYYLDAVIDVPFREENNITFKELILL
jgi:hypothetical protein